MNFSIKKISFLFLKRKNREQYFILFLTLGVFYFLWDSSINAWYAAALEKTKLESVIMSGEILELKNQKILLSSAEAHKEFELLKKTVSAQEHEYADLKDKANRAKENITSPREIVKLIKEILKKTQGVRLVSVEGLPAIVLNAEETGVKQDSVQLYKPGLKLVLEGDYFQTMALLKGLEESNWRVYWESLDYAVKSYPTAVVEISIRTLSTEKDWIGV